MFRERGQLQARADGVRAQAAREWAGCCGLPGLLSECLELAGRNDKNVRVWSVWKQILQLEVGVVQKHPHSFAGGMETRS